MYSRFIQISLLAIALNACAQPPVASDTSNSNTSDALPSASQPVNGSAPQTQSPSSPSPSAEVTKPQVGSAPSPGLAPMMEPVSPATSTPPAEVSSEGDGRTDGKWKTVVKVSNLTVKSQSFDIKPSDSKIFPQGNGKAPNRDQKASRKVEVFIPDGLDKTKEHPFMIIQDDWYQGNIIPIVSRLIVDKKIPMMIMVHVQNGGGDSTGSQRGLEYDVLGPNNAKFLTTEILPMIESKYGVKFTKDGEGGGIFGGSSSGAAAFTAAWFYPERIRKVLAYSATFVPQGPSKDYPKGAAEYGQHLIKEAEVKPIRVSLEVSTTDNPGFMQGNIDVFNALTAKGYHVRLNVVPNAGHVDGGVMQGSVADNMIWLWRDYPK